MSLYVCVCGIQILLRNRFELVINGLRIGSVPARDVLAKSKQVGPVYIPVDTRSL